MRKNCSTSWEGSRFLRLGGGGSLLDLEYEYDNVGNVEQIEDGQAQTQSFTYDALDRPTGESAQAGGPWAAYTGSYEYDRVGKLRLKAEGGITHTMQYSNTAHVHAVSAEDRVAQAYDPNENPSTTLRTGAGRSLSCLCENGDFSSLALLEMTGLRWLPTTAFPYGFS